jgi:hypothetical protein
MYIIYNGMSPHTGCVPAYIAHRRFKHNSHMHAHRHIYNGGAIDGRQELCWRKEGRKQRRKEEYERHERI